MSSTAAGLVGQTIFVIDGAMRRVYPIRGSERIEGNIRVYTKREGAGFEARPAKQWELPVTACWPPE